eukprot:TRINITY_DN813_c0_g5_i1.p1 TRINITY_DN813_c0_g5~~TRINITY_DN813_c0_g5_i1.p1  ORF type:complete len:457 (+),score=195.50 TRINITY_DN813_c0_g5_i1:51-1373(+)
MTSSLLSSCDAADVACDFSLNACIGVVDDMLSAVESMRADVASSPNSDTPLDDAERAQVVNGLKRVFVLTRHKAWTRRAPIVAATRLRKEADRVSTPSREALDSALSPLLSDEALDAFRAYDCAQHAPLLRATLGLFARSGRMDCARALARHDDDLGRRFERLAAFDKLHHIVSELRQRRLGPALEWLTALLAARGEGDDVLALDNDAARLAFTLHELAYVELLGDTSVPSPERRARAFAYGREQFAPFAALHWKRIGQLFGAALYIDDADSANCVSAGNSNGSSKNDDATLLDVDDPSPYATLFGGHDDAWEQASLDVARVFAASYGTRPTALLDDVMRCALHALPTLQKLAALKQSGLAVDAAAHTLPLEQRDWHHTVFVCPVSRTQTEPNNPPVLLPCGHVIARSSATQLASARGMQLKCIYCPQLTTLRTCKTISF